MNFNPFNAHAPANGSVLYPLTCSQCPYRTNCVSVHCLLIAYKKPRINKSILGFCGLKSVILVKSPHYFLVKTWVAYRI